MRSIKSLITFACLLLLLPVQGWAAAAHVQSCSNSTGGFGTASCSMTVTAGNGIAIGAWLSGPNTISSVSDATNTYVAPSGCSDVAARGMRYALNITGGTLTFTVTFSGASIGGITVHEFSGADTFDVCAGMTTDPANTAGTDEIKSGAATTTGSSDYVFGVVSHSCCSNVTVTAGTGYTLAETETDDVTFKGWSEYKANVSAGSQEVKFTTANTTLDYYVGMMAFKSSGAAAPKRSLMLLGVGQ